ncbi:MAG: thymidine phosphorylase [Verrucomicrobia subdivision 3 bacterium]|nr:thymidine phosphorylase [Limisphaerales bacterium]
MNCLPQIEAKRDGRALSGEEILNIVCAYTRGEIPDYQMAALLMAIVCRGMDAAETRALTVAMRDSGERLSFPADPRPLVDKHSTGGVGDKVSLPLAPLLACLGFRVPMISGRGLGVTGGTLDKLESIPGFTTALPTKRIIEQVQKIGCAMCGQTDEIAPADKAIYALRDVTGTMPSIPLLTSSILSKKLAERLDCLLLDVKFGAAAFMKIEEQALELAETIVRLGNECGVKTRALLTDMNTPLGRSAGNWLEVREAVECLSGRGPADLEELVIECAAHLLVLSGTAGIENARREALGMLRSGEPLERWDQMLAAQGADLKRYREKLKQDATAGAVALAVADRRGFVNRCDARLIGEVVRELGGGRLQKGSVINPAVGIDGIAKPGDHIEQGMPIGRVHAKDQREADQAAACVRAAFEISDASPKLTPLVRKMIE